MGCSQLFCWEWQWFLVMREILMSNYREHSTMATDLLEVPPGCISADTSQETNSAKTEGLKGIDHLHANFDKAEGDNLGAIHKTFRKYRSKENEFAGDAQPIQPCLDPIAADYHHNEDAEIGNFGADRGPGTWEDHYEELQQVAENVQFVSHMADPTVHILDALPTPTENMIYAKLIE